MDIRLLFIGDIVGENGLAFLIDTFPKLKEKYNPNFIVTNGENIWQGKGLNEEDAKLLFKSDVDVITTGNHIWENWKSRPLLASNDRVLRPMNYPSGNPGKGSVIVEKHNIKIAVAQLQGRTFLQTIDCPFRAADAFLHNLDGKADVIIIDFHAETTAEKMAMGWHLDGRVAAMLGTHTHVQTADAQILPNGTAFISDVGMTGPYDSVLGMRKDIALKRYILQTAHKFELAESDMKVAGAYLEIDSNTGQANYIEPFVYPQFNTKSGI
ncbi:MAG: TIGR00282 family metallophosphoesterase [Candidatus Kapabacteria bacterium]|nr:TIGR00282 family metallophosphoesterase [Candidatus Kapabacteria bacterium]